MAGKLDFERIGQFVRFLEQTAVTARPSLRAVALSGWSQGALAASMPAFDWDGFEFTEEAAD